MAWTLPTVAEFKAAFPDFAAVADAVIDTQIVLAEVSVPQSLPSQAVFTAAAGLYLAHQLTMAGQGTSPEATAVADGLSGFSSVSDGATSFTRRDMTGGSGEVSSAFVTFKETNFGRRYQELVRRYFVPMGVITGDT